MGKKMLFEDICWFGVVCNFFAIFLARFRFYL